MARAKETFLRSCGWLIHLYTAFGVVTGLVALYFIERSRFRAAFLVMAAALFIDSTDGPFARLVQIRKRIPEFDGATLDNIVDYLNYVVVPAFLMLNARILPDNRAGLAIAGVMMIASTYGFSRVDAKTEDLYFRGFPSYWNLVALYLYVLPLSQSLNGVIVLALSAMVFAPLKFIYPNRTAPLRTLTLTLAGIWSIATLLLVILLPTREPVLLCISLAFVVYYFLVSWMLQFYSVVQNHTVS